MLQTRYMHPLVAVLLLSAFALAPDAAAQLQPEARINLALGLPQGDFQDQVDNPGFGATLYGGVGLEGGFVTIGAEFGFLVYGHERRREPFSLTIPDVRVDVTTSNNIALGHAILRLQPPRGLVQPYVEGLIGFKYFFTQTSIDGNDPDGDPVASSTNFDDTALSYGGGGGLDIRVYDGRYLDKPQIFINLGVRYLLGGDAEYLKEGAITRADGEVFFDVTRSATDMLIPQLGVTFKF